MSTACERQPSEFASLGPGPLRADAFDLVAITALINLSQIAHSSFYLLVVILASGCAMIWRRARRSAWFWMALAAVWAPRLILHWETNEDHVYVGAYWCLAIGLSLLGGDAPTILARNARWMIGLTFALACVWKLTSADYLDGSLFHYKLLFDYRFREGLTIPLAGLSMDTALANVEAIRELRNAGSDLREVSLQFPAKVSWLAQAMTWWTLLIEAALALMFLFANHPFCRRLKDVGLLVFALTTYLVVPVLGFGCLFMSMGLAQCEPRQHYARWAYFITSLILMAFMNLG